jgi:hypothetical protein
MTPIKEKNGHYEQQKQLSENVRLMYDVCTINVR